MSSFVTYISCPQCGNLATVDLNCHTGEESCVCDSCGYKCQYKRTLDETGAPLIGKDGKWLYSKETTQGFGTAYIYFREGWPCIFDLATGVSRQELKRIREVIREKHRSGVLCKWQCRLYVWDSHAKKLKVVFGVRPQKLSDFEPFAPEELRRCRWRTLQIRLLELIFGKYKEIGGSSDLPF